MTYLKHSIDPLVDCVFKALLGAAENINLTIDFLNAILKPEAPIQEVEILNPYNERAFLGDKLTIVDVKVKDSQGLTYQIEVQLAVFEHVPARMLYTWSDIYQSQLGSGDNFNELKPVVSIWLLGKNLFKTSSSHHHHFQAIDSANNVKLSDYFSIHVLELAKWRKKSALLDKEDQWFYFFQSAKDWKQLPDELDNPEMRQAMQVLTGFSEKEKAYHLYQSRQNALREEATKKHLLEEAERQKREAVQEKLEAIQEKQAAVQEKQAAVQEKRAAVQEKDHAIQKMLDAIDEKERLIALLRKSGMDYE